MEICVMRKVSQTRTHNLIIEKPHNIIEVGGDQEQERAYGEVTEDIKEATGRLTAV